MIPSAHVVNFSPCTRVLSNQGRGWCGLSETRSVLSSSTSASEVSRFIRCEFVASTVAMNSQAAAPTTMIIPVKVTMLVQCLVCFGIFASTVSITRSVVASNVAKLNANLAHLRSPSGALQLNKPSPTTSPIPIHPNNTTVVTSHTVTTLLDYTKFHGYIVSNKEQRYNHSKLVLEKLGMVPHQYEPLSYKSDAVRKAMEDRTLKGKYLTDRYKKVFSNRLAFTYLFQQFVDDDHAALDSWRFFFEDDVALHPSLSKSLAQKVLARGLEVAAEDGILYLGICGPKDCKKKVVTLASHVEAKQCAGSCTHAFGMTKWKTRRFLEYMDKVRVTSPMYFDQLMRTFGEQVHKIWIIGSNLKSPQTRNHFGLVFQDRTHYPSIIDAREPQQ